MALPTTADRAAFEDKMLYTAVEKATAHCKPSLATAEIATSVAYMFVLLGEGDPALGGRIA
ncbi:hypothetical protein [Rhizobium mongolense]|uniref:hypothetical protein n=1 Tax=Rhizobium mongolense TaxID=57676 RepID=UPI00111371A0|nr:hypothetical protein [Rhizobium mongolense]